MLLQEDSLLSGRDPALGPSLREIYAPVLEATGLSGTAPVAEGGVSGRWLGERALLEVARQTLVRCGLPVTYENLHRASLSVVYAESSAAQAQAAELLARAVIDLSNDRAIRSLGLDMRLSRLDAADLDRLSAAIGSALSPDGGITA